MAFGMFTEEQEEFRSIVRDFLTEKSGEQEVRRLMATEEGYDRGVWKQLAQELGAVGLAIPEEYGGQGFTWSEFGILLEEAGRSLLAAPLFSTAVLAATALLESGDEAAKQKYLPGIAAGETIATVALTEASGSWDEDGIAATATAGGDGWVVSGSKHFVIDGATADLLIVPAVTERGISLFAVEGTAAGVSRTPSITLDETRKLAVIELTDAPAQLIGEEGAGWAILERVYDVAGVALALEQTGGAQAALDMSIEYMKARVQFGQPIGAFQALKHMAADVLVEVEGAKSAAYYALDALVSGSEEFPVASSLAQAFCSEAYVTSAHQNIQFHGGMGFTWEVPAHLYYKRARSSEVLLGDADFHRSHMATRIGI